MTAPTLPDAHDGRRSLGCQTALRRRAPWPALQASLSRWKCFIPRRCVVCLTWDDEVVCRACQGLAQADRLVAGLARCPRCMAPLPSAACRRCAASPPPWSALVYGVEYGFPWAGLLHRFKYRDAVELAQPLAQLSWRAWTQQAQVPLPDCFTPVPLDRRRLRERGYNQAWLLAQALGRGTGRPAVDGWLAREQRLDHQAGLDRGARAHNVSGTMHALPSVAARRAGAHVALVDDVLTTGATASEAARALLDGGAQRVDLWVVARTP